VSVTIDTAIHAGNVTPLHKARAAAGMTQHEFAEATGWSRSFIAMVETGRRSLDEEQREHAAFVLERYRKVRIQRRADIARMLDRMPMTAEQLAMLHGAKA